MRLSCGIVGLPNVGKSTLFNALTGSQVSAENFPFCTVEPNTAVVPVPDDRLYTIADIVQPKGVVPTTMRFVDIAGLIRGASQGEGLGNRFLANIREVDAIAHVVRCFDDDQVTHVGGKISPTDDIGVINTELALADLETSHRVTERLLKLARVGDKDARVTLALLERVTEVLDGGDPVRSMGLSGEDTSALAECNFLTAKPVVYVANIDDPSSDTSALVQEVKAVAAEDAAEVVTISGKLEEEIAQLPVEERDEFLDELGFAGSGLDRFITCSYTLLKLHHFFTTNSKEVSAWTIPIGTHAQQAAGEIHTDFERGFIRAEVIAYSDFVACGGEQVARSKGLCRSEGRDYEVVDGDVIRFLFNV